MSWGRKECNRAGTESAGRLRREPTRLMRPGARRGAGDMCPTVSVGREITRKLVSAAYTRKITRWGKDDRHDEVTDLRSSDRRSRSIGSHVSEGRIHRIRSRRRNS